MNLLTKIKTHWKTGLWYFCFILAMKGGGLVGVMIYLGLTQLVKRYYKKEQIVE